MSAIVEQARTRLEEVRGTLKARAEELRGPKGSLLGSKGLLGSSGQLFGGTILGEPGKRIPQPLWEKLPSGVQTRIQDIRKLRSSGILARVGAPATGGGPSPSPATKEPPLVDRQEPVRTRTRVLV